MSLLASPSLLLAVTALLVAAGAVNGLAGFGFALVGTMGLAIAVEPATAVVFMIVPILAVNLSLARELSPSSLRQCSRRFWPLILAALVGTLFGMTVVSRVPAGPLRVGLGIVTLAFVATVQRRFGVPGLEGIRDWCFVDRPAAMAGVGAVGGLLYGGTNVGVQLVAYLRSFDLDHAVFVGVVAVVFLGLNAVRIGAAAVLGLYPGTAMLAGSVAAAVPAVLGVALGKRIRARVSRGTPRLVVLALLTVVGWRLVLGGSGIL